MKGGTSSRLFTADSRKKGAVGFAVQEGEPPPLVRQHGNDNLLLATATASSAAARAVITCLRDSAFFSRIDWQRLLDRELPPPMTPNFQPSHTRPPSAAQALRRWQARALHDGWLRWVKVYEGKKGSKIRRDGRWKGWEIGSGRRVKKEQAKKRVDPNRRVLWPGLSMSAKEEEERYEMAEAAGKEKYLPQQVGGAVITKVESHQTSERRLRTEPGAVTRESSALAWPLDRRELAAPSNWRLKGEPPAAVPPSREERLFGVRYPRLEPLASGGAEKLVHRARRR